MLVYILHLKKSKNTLVTSYFQPMTMKIPGSLIRLPTITSKRRHSVKLFHFITSSFFFFVIRPLPSFLRRYHQLYYFVLFWRCNHSGASVFPVDVLEYSLTLGLNLFLTRSTLPRHRQIFILLIYGSSLHRIYHPRYKLELWKSSLNLEKAN